ncbi:hypothetical protein D3C85_343700 [compost metagenome]
MTCVRCEVVRAKAIAMGMAGLRRTGEQIVAELRGRYGDVYQLDGRRVVRKSSAEDIFIIEVRR